MHRRDFALRSIVTAPTGIRELNKKHGVDIGAMLVGRDPGTLSVRYFRNLRTRRDASQRTAAPRTDRS